MNLKVKGKKCSPQFSIKIQIREGSVVRTMLKSVSIYQIQEILFFFPFFPGRVGAWTLGLHMDPREGQHVNPRCSKCSILLPIKIQKSNFLSFLLNLLFIYPFASLF